MCATGCSRRASRCARKGRKNSRRASRGRCRCGRTSSTRPGSGSTSVFLPTETSMPHLATDDGINLYYEEVGSGIPIVFVHEFAGDCRSYEPQLRYFGRRYRCIAYNARGYPPSDVPQTVERYSQDRARDDIRCVLDALKIDTAHIVGLSMGGFATLHFGFTYGQRALPPAGVVVMPNSGRAINVEEPAAFSRHLEEFLHAIDVGAWRNRDPRAMAPQILGR